MLKSRNERLDDIAWYAMLQDFNKALAAYRGFPKRSNYHSTKVYH